MGANQTGELNGRIVGVLIALALTLSACGAAAETPTATAVEPSTFSEATAAPELAVIAQTIAVQPAGTLGYVNENQTPGANQPLVFELVQLETIEQALGTDVVINIFADGRVQRDGLDGRISPDEVEALRGMLDAIQFYDIQGVFTGQGGADSTTRVYLTVSGPRGSRTLTADNGNTPDELQALFALIRLYGDRAGEKPTATS